VDGRLRSRSYDNAQGQRVYVVEVACDSVQFLETRAARERQQMQQQSQPQQQVRQDDFYDMKTVDLEKDFDNSFNSFDIMEDDIQF
jgi:single-strand DNA-binding protein